MQLNSQVKETLVILKNVSGLLDKYSLLTLGLVLFAASLALYLNTLAPTVTFIDSGFLAAVIATGGVYHPAGFPLYMILGSVVAALPVGSLIFRLNALSAVCSAIGVALTCLVFVFGSRERADTVEPIGTGVRAISASRSTRGKRRTRLPASARKLWHGLEEPLALAGGFAAALAWMGNRVLWRTSTATEVYALYALLFITLSLFLVLYARASWANRDREAQQWLGFASFTMGLGLTNDLKIIMFVPAIIFLLLRVEGRALFSRWPRNLVMLALIAAPLLMYVILPLRASADPILNWGDPSNWKNFWEHVTAKQYSVFVGPARPETVGHIFSVWLLDQPLIVPLAAVGLVGIWIRQRTWFWFMSILVVTNFLSVLAYDISSAEGGPSDFDNYLLVLLWVTSLWAGAGVAVLILFLTRRLKTGFHNWKSALLHGPFLSWLPFVLAFVPLLSVPFNWDSSSRRSYTYADDYVRTVLTQVEPNALILTEDWNFVAPAAYLQLVEGLRPDVLVVDGELLRRTWYFSYIRKRAPWLYDKAGKSISAFLPELAKFENNESYNGDVITNAYIAMLNDFLSRGQADGHPPYVLLSPELKGMSQAEYDSIERSLRHPPYLTIGVPPNAIGDQFQWVPQTPAFRLYPDKQNHTLIDMTLKPASFSGRGYYDDDTRSLIKRYADCWRRRGDYYKAHGDCPTARTEYAKALELVPDLLDARSGLAACPAG